MQYRVKQIDENCFLAQCRTCFLIKWENIDRVDNYTWCYDVSNAIHPSLQDAMNTINRYRVYIKNKTQYPKYYKMSYKPNTNAN
jgi:hypothetical protein